MAASMKTARIGLSFDKSGLENSWFLVDFSRHSKIEDVSDDIMSNYFSDMTFCEQKIVLRINNFLLPSSASSELFRENDIVTVRLESRELDESEAIQKVSGKWVHSQSDVSHSNSSLADIGESGYHKQKEIRESGGHKRKRKHSESDSTEKHKSLKHKKKKKHSHTKESSDVEEDVEQSPTESGTQNNEAKKRSKGKDAHTKSTGKIESSASTSYEIINKREAKNCESNDVTTDQKIVKLKKKSAKGDLNHLQVTNEDEEADMDSELKQVTVDDMVENVPDNTTINGNASSHSDKSLENSTEKRKRVRKRKRRKRSVQTKEDNSNADGDSRKFGLSDRCQTYRGSEVDKNKTGLYGHLPDKLEPPKYYRHGYRNLNMYTVEPNNHIKFDEYSKPGVTEECTKQYNFMCKSRKVPEDESVNNGNDQSETVIESQDAKPETGANDVGSFSTQDDSEAFQNESKTKDDCKQKWLSIQNELYSATPFNYDDSSMDTNFDYTKNESVAMETSPVSLDRKTLSSGVSVFVRKRSSQASPFRGFSKQEQLDTKMTNVSTIFQNPCIDKDFKVPSSPAPKPELSLSKQCSPMVNGSTTSTPNLQPDLSESKPLIGAPNAGDIIAYKVLEISATCTPEVSEYKVAKVLNVDEKQMLELKNLQQADNKEKQITKFHVEIEDETEILTNTESESEVVTLHLSSLLEPKKVTSA